MALSTVIRGAVRAYFQREWNDQFMNSYELPPAAVLIMSQVYVLLGWVFLTLPIASNVTGVTMLLGINQRSLYVALWNVTFIFFWFWATIGCAKSFVFFYGLSDASFIIGILESSASIVFHDSPFSPLALMMYLASSLFVRYVTAYSQLMARRIVQNGEKRLAIHAIYLFTDFPYVCYHFARMGVEDGIIRRRRGGVPEQV
ncbi:hypothetical protein ABFX02_02G156800 [Erythranthe guttata]